MKYIATLSYGKDSTAMCDLLLKNGYPVDYIVFNDTLSEYPIMYEYKKKVDEYFKLRYGINVTSTIPIRNLKDSILRKVARSKTESRNGQYIGVPVPSGEAMCHLRKTLKVEPFEKWIRKNIKEDYKVYIGFTTDETSRCKNDGVSIYPLVEYFKMSELDCKKYLIEQEMENPLYKNFNRTGCALCPYKSEQDWFQVYKHYPKLFNQAKEIEKELSKQDEFKFFHKLKPLSEHEKQFKRDDVSLFDFSDEPIKDCFCKI